MNNERLTARDLHPGDIVLMASAGLALDPTLLVILPGHRYTPLAPIGRHATDEKIPYGATFEVAYPRTTEMRGRDRQAAVSTVRVCEKRLQEALSRLSTTARAALSEHDITALGNAVSDTAGDAVLLATALVEVEYHSDRLLANMEPGDCTVMQFAGLTSRWAMTGLAGNPDRRFETKMMLALSGPLKGMMRQFLVPKMREPIVDHEALVRGDVVELRGRSGMAWEVIDGPDVSDMALSKVAAERFAGGVRLRCIFDNAEDQMTALALTLAESGPSPADVSVTSKVGTEVTIHRGDGETMIQIGRSDLQDGDGDWEYKGGRWQHKDAG